MRKHHYCTLFFLCLLHFVNGQVFRSSLPTGLDKGKDTNNEILTIQNNYIITVEEQDGGFYKVTISDSEEKSASFDLKPFTYDLFEAKFLSTYVKVIKESESKEVLPKTIIEGTNVPLTRLFARVVSYFNTTNERPLVANISLKNGIKAHWGECNQEENNNKKTNPIPNGNGIQLENVKVELTFYQGYIEKIEVSGELQDEIIRFTNKYSIGISSNSNIRQLNNHRLFSYHTYDDIKSQPQILVD